MGVSRRAMVMPWGRNHSTPQRRGHPPARSRARSSRRRGMSFLPIQAGSFAVEIVDSGTKEALPHIAKGGKFAVVCRPGAEFYIRIKRAPSGDDWGDKVTAICRIDDSCPGYTMMMARGSTVTFDGFFKGMLKDGVNANMVAFKFAELQDDEAEERQRPALESLDQLKAGKITLDFWKAVPTGKTTNWAVQPPGGAAGPDSFKLPPGKKAFLAPTVHTQEGSQSSAKWSASPAYLRTQQIQSLSIVYERAQTLVLRKVLDPAIPSHMEVIEKFTDLGRAQSRSPSPPPRPRQQQRQGQRKAPAAAKAAAPPKAAASSAASAARAAVKVEKRPGAAAGSSDGEEAAGGAARGPTVVDLLGPAAPLVVGRRVVDPRKEVAVCDLTGNRGSAGSWRVQKKQKIDITK